MHTLKWGHNERDCVSNHQPHDCLLNCLFKARIKENIKAPRHWPLWGKFTGDRWIPPLRTSHAENVSIWWRHHDFNSFHRSQFLGKWIVRPQSRTNIAYTGIELVHKRSVSQIPQCTRPISYNTPLWNRRCTINPIKYAHQIFMFCFAMGMISYLRLFIGSTYPHSQGCFASTRVIIRSLQYQRNNPESYG